MHMGILFLFQYAGVYQEVGDNIPTCSRYKPEEVATLCQKICYKK